MVDRKKLEELVELLESEFRDKLSFSISDINELTVEFDSVDLIVLCNFLKDNSRCRFEQLVDLCGVDYLTYGLTDESGLESVEMSEPRFAVVYHLLSLTNNQRIRLRAFVNNKSLSVSSVVDIWPSANWYEREAFDLLGISFSDHPDLRRIYTDYGFEGHPLRKDFPIIGEVEVIYDPERKKVVNQAVTIENRQFTPKVIREDLRYE